MTVGCVLKLLNIEYELKEVTKWCELRTYFELPIHVLDSIGLDNPTVERRRSEMLQYWLRNGKAPLWEKIMKALQSIGVYARIVESIKSKYIPGT